MPIFFQFSYRDDTLNTSLYTTIHGILFNVRITIDILLTWKGMSVDDGFWQT